MEHPHGAFLLAQLLAGSHPTFQLPKSDRDPKEAFRLFNKCAELNFPPAQVELARCYELGLLGCKIDPKLSVIWNRRAAELGDAEAALALSSWCAKGAPGIFNKDERAAFEWCKRAVDKGNPLAEYVFGYYHENAIGVKLDKNVAILWYKKAAKDGNEMAKKRLEVLEKNKPPAPVSRPPPQPPRPQQAQRPQQQQAYPSQQPQQHQQQQYHQSGFRPPTVSYNPPAGLPPGHYAPPPPQYNYQQPVYHVPQLQGPGYAPPQGYAPYRPTYQYPGQQYPPRKKQDDCGMQ